MLLYSLQTPSCISPLFLAASAICPTLYQDTQLQKLQSFANINKNTQNVIHHGYALTFCVSDSQHK